MRIITCVQCDKWCLALVRQMIYRYMHFLEFCSCFPACKSILFLFLSLVLPVLLYNYFFHIYIQYTRHMREDQIPYSKSGGYLSLPSDHCWPSVNTEIQSTEGRRWRCYRGGSMHDATFSIKVKRRKSSVECWIFQHLKSVELDVMI